MELARFARERRRLPGIEVSGHRAARLGQVVEGVRRVTYVLTLSEREISGLRADPASEVFAPLRASSLRVRGGEREEAFWLAFLGIHFGKSRVSGWRLVRDIYGGMGARVWDWR